jgi:hypothetical protein
MRIASVQYGKILRLGFDNNYLSVELLVIWIGNMRDYMRLSYLNRWWDNSKFI